MVIKQVASKLFTDSIIDTCGILFYKIPKALRLLSTDGVAKMSLQADAVTGHSCSRMVMDVDCYGFF